MLRSLWPGMSAKGNAMRAAFFLLMMLLLAGMLLICGCESKKTLVSGDVAPEFSAQDVTGKSFSLSQMSGKIVVLYFWRNSCCSDRLKLVEPLYRTYKGSDVEVVAVNAGDAMEKVAAYAKGAGITFTMVSDPNLEIFNRYHVLGFPTIFLIDKHGTVRNKVLGEVSNPALEKLILRQLEVQKKADEAYGKAHGR